MDRSYHDHYPHAFVLRVVDTVIGIIELMLGLRLLLEFLGANPASAFVAWLYSVTDTLSGPFAGAFPSLAVGGFVLDLSIIFAMIGYGLIGWLIAQLLSFVFALP